MDWDSKKPPCGGGCGGGWVDGLLHSINAVGAMFKP